MTDDWLFGLKPNPGAFDRDAALFHAGRATARTGHAWKLACAGATGRPPSLARRLVQRQVRRRPSSANRCRSYRRPSKSSRRPELLTVEVPRERLDYDFPRRRFELPPLARGPSDPAPSRPPAHRRLGPAVFVPLQLIRGFCMTRLILAALALTATAVASVAQPPDRAEKRQVHLPPDCQPRQSRWNRSRGWRFWCRTATSGKGTPCRRSWTASRSKVSCSAASRRPSAASCWNCPSTTRPSPPR